jgi:hypothetical protein
MDQTTLITDPRFADLDPDLQFFDPGCHEQQRRQIWFTVYIEKVAQGSKTVEAKNAADHAMRDLDEAFKTPAERS